ncbi:hypothetical protein [Massilia sp. CT11-137]|uniref:hypothetical protein n=1 Tax=Massilia sp. CT11-137 TaxID=3393901 RepID=UPI0039B09BF1
MSKRQYPRQAWVLLPSFKPKELTITQRSHPYSSMFESWDLASDGKSYHFEKLHPNKDAAIAAGRDLIEKARANIAKRQETMNKRIAALDKAEKGSK